MAEKKEYVRECLIETDLEVLIPDDYISSISERLVLYKELNDLESDEQLEAFRTRLIDRFGPIPQATEQLVQTITLRRMAKVFGIEKLVLKQQKMGCHFSHNQDNPFYHSNNFMKMIAFANAHPTVTRLKQATDHLVLSYTGIDTITQAINVLKEITH